MVFVLATNKYEKKGRSNDDLSYFPPIQRWLIGKCLCVPPSVTLADTVKGSRLAMFVFSEGKGFDFCFYLGTDFFVRAYRVYGRK